MGRPFWRSNGIPSGGAADATSHRIANFLTANPATAATLEVAGGGLKAVIEKPGRLAHTGPGGILFLNKKEIPANRPVFAPEGAVLEIKPATGGHYSYLATPGGWDVPVVLGSRSTCFSAGFGGFQGRMLRRGDVLESLTPSDKPRPSVEHNFSTDIRTGAWYAGYRLFPLPVLSGTQIRVLPGPEISCWNEASQTRFFDTAFTVTAGRDRMGVRLGGAPVAPSLKTEMLSTAVMPGTIQVPPDGQPLVLMADAQTTGGYPRIACIIATDIPLFAQIPVGYTVHFQKITLEEAEQLLFEHENMLRKIQLALRFKLPDYGIR